MMKTTALAPFLGLVLACGSPTASAVNSSDAGTQALDAALPQCANASDPPTTLECTGLYADMATKRISPTAHPYAPAIPLWADSADKLRWIELPPGTTIDTTNPDEWTFPVGTKAWKEFSRGGTVVETRYFHKQDVNFWVRGTYLWDATTTTATIGKGGDIPLNGGTYHVPTGDECDQCHKGRTDRLLGFEQVSLGLPGATGWTLAQLAAEQRLSPVPALTELKIGDDGTAAAAPALAWLHINCGTTCHNANQNATGYAAGMRLRLDPTTLDGRSSAAFLSRMTTLNIGINSPQWDGATRIVPGDPDSSLLVQLISHRGTGNQMPPIASDVVDDEAVAAVSGWVRRMPLAPDAGTPDAN